MKSAITVRAPRAEDAPGMARVHVRAWQETYRGMMDDVTLDDPDLPSRREHFWAAALTRPDDGWHIAVAEAEEEIVGIAMAGPATGDQPGDRQLYVLYLLARHHGSGAGARLMDEVLEDAAAVSLWVADPNSRAQAFYRRQGFSADGARRTQDGITDIRMLRTPVSMKEIPRA